MSTTPLGHPPAQNVPTNLNTQSPPPPARMSITTHCFHKWKRHRKEGEIKKKGPKVFTTFRPKGDPNDAPKVVSIPTNVYDIEIMDLDRDISKQKAFLKGT